MEGRFIHYHYYIPEFYNKVLKNKQINTNFLNRPWNVKERIEFLKYIKRGFPTTPIVLTKDISTGVYIVIDGYNRLMVISDFILGGFDGDLSEEEIELIEKMSIDVYIAAAPLRPEDMAMIRSVFHGSCESKSTDTTKIITQEKKIIIHQKTKIPKKQINEALKTSVWNKYIGADKGNAPCYVCQTTFISQREFDTGHVIAEINGGQTNLSNLRPICRKCNLSMGAQNMDIFIEKYFTREG
jgi:hypothetical protein